MEAEQAVPLSDLLDDSITNSNKVACLCCDASDLRGKGFLGLVASLELSLALLGCAKGPETPATPKIQTHPIVPRSNLACAGTEPAWLCVWNAMSLIMLGFLLHKVTCVCLEEQRRAELFAFCGLLIRAQTDQKPLFNFCSFIGCRSWRLQDETGFFKNPEEAELPARSRCRFKCQGDQVVFESASILPNMPGLPSASVLSTALFKLSRQYSS